MIDLLHTRSSCTRQHRSVLNQLFTCSDPFQMNCHMFTIDVLKVMCGCQHTSAQLAAVWSLEQARAHFLLMKRALSVCFGCLLRLRPQALFPNGKVTTKNGQEVNLDFDAMKQVHVCSQALVSVHASLSHALGSVKKSSRVKFSDLLRLPLLQDPEAMSNPSAYADKLRAKLVSTRPIEERKKKGWENRRARRNVRIRTSVRQSTL